MHAVKEVTAGCYSMEKYLALLVLLLVFDVAENRAEMLDKVLLSIFRDNSTAKVR